MRSYWSCTNYNWIRSPASSADWMTCTLGTTKLLPRLSLYSKPTSHHCRWVIHSQGLQRHLRPTRRWGREEGETRFKAWSGLSRDEEASVSPSRIGFNCISAGLNCPLFRLVSNRWVCRQRDQFVCTPMSLDMPTKTRLLHFWHFLENVDQHIGKSWTTSSPKMNKEWSNIFWLPNGINICG